MSDAGREQPWSALLRHCRAFPGSASVLLAAIAFGLVEFLLWGRTHMEDGIPLILLLLLASYHILSGPMPETGTGTGGKADWAVLCLAALLMACAAAFTNSRLYSGRSLPPMLCKNGAILCLALAVSMRMDGLRCALRLLPPLLLAIVVIPLYELLLLQFSYPLRLVSTAFSVFFLKLCSFSVSYDGTSIIWRDQVISITEACSGISLLGMLLLIEYIVVRPIRADSWKKWCWSSLLLLWVILGNALRMLLTFLLYMPMGRRVHEATPHFLLGCFFVVATSLMIWGSSFILRLDAPEDGRE